MNNFFGHDLAFWFAILGASVIKVIASAQQSFLQSLLTVGIAVFCAFVFTEPALVWFGLDPDTFRNALAAVVALTDEGLARALIRFSREPQAFLVDLIKKRFGK